MQVSPAKLQTMMNEAVAADEIIWLQRRVGHLTDERRRLKDRAAEREELQEAVFATLNRRVADGQAEIQARLHTRHDIIVRSVDSPSMWVECRKVFALRCTVQSASRHSAFPVFGE